MSKPRVHHLLALLLASACGGETTVVQVDVASVTVSPSAATVEVGLTLQFTAEARDASGTPVTGQPVTWTSTNGSVASIDTNGVATGLVVGSTQVRATVDGVTGTQTLTVEPSSCAGVVLDVVLNPGEYAVFAGDDCLLLPAGSAGDLYRVAIARPTLVANANNAPSVTLSMSPVLTTAPPRVEDAPSPAPSTVARQRFGTIDGSRALRHLEWQDATRAFHMELRRREQALGLSRSALLPSAAPAGAPLALVDPPATDSMFLRLSCSATLRQPVTLVGFSDYIALYQETAAYDTLAISTQAANELLGYYESYVHAMVQAWWDRIPDTNSDGRVTIVTTPELDENVAAAVYSGDYYQTIGGCPGSNERETIYFQDDVIINLDPPTGQPDYFAFGVLAHEMKHVISLYNGIERGDLMGGPPEFHDLWIEEGTAEVSQAISSRIAWAATGGPELGEPITATNLFLAVQANGGTETKEMTGLIDVLAGMVRSLSSQPNSLLTDPTGAPSEHSFYASSWHWHNFLGDGYGNASEVMDSAFFRALTDPTTPAGGASGEIQLTGVADFNELFEEFVVAVSLHGSGFTAARPIDTWDFISAGSVFRSPNPPGDYPWPVTADETNQWDPFTSKTYTGTIGPSGVRFHDFRSDGSAAGQISVRGSSQPCDPGTPNAGERCDFIIVTRLD